MVLQAPSAVPTCGCAFVGGLPQWGCHPVSISHVSVLQKSHLLPELGCLHCTDESKRCFSNPCIKSRYLQLVAHKRKLSLHHGLLFHDAFSWRQTEWLSWKLCWAMVLQRGASAVWKTDPLLVMKFNKMRLFSILLLFVLSVLWYCHQMEWDFWPIRWYTCHLCIHPKRTNEVNVTTTPVHLRLNTVWPGVFGTHAGKKQNLTKHFMILVQICSYSAAFLKSARHILILLFFFS